MFVNNQSEPNPITWKVSKTTTPLERMTNGNKWSDETHYFIIESDNKRFKFLYFNGTNVGTRRTLGLKYATCYRSRVERREAKERREAFDYCSKPRPIRPRPEQ